jgi:hypothetical protein
MLKHESVIRNFGNTSLTHEVSACENAIGINFGMGPRKWQGVCCKASSF